MKQWCVMLDLTHYQTAYWANFWCVTFHCHGQVSDHPCLLSLARKASQYRKLSSPRLKILFAISSLATSFPPQFSSSIGKGWKLEGDSAMEGGTSMYLLEIDKEDYQTEVKQKQTKTYPISAQNKNFSVKHLLLWLSEYIRNVLYWFSSLYL